MYRISKRTQSKAIKSQLDLNDWMMFCVAMALMLLTWLYFVGVAVSWGRCDFGAWWLGRSHYTSPLVVLETIFTLICLAVALKMFICKRVTIVRFLSIFTALFMLVTLHDLRGTIQFDNWKHDRETAVGIPPISSELSRWLIKPIKKILVAEIQMGQGQRRHIDPDYEIKRKIREQLICEHPFFDPWETWEEEQRDIEERFRALRKVN
ncbi:hypothetical protein [Umboniibacter marinipuniceus]|uniref:Uncharacterized protein n=1 Tax=Umboniibacter marinipuniceus TaxID=569599 RepID=A0A3M0AJ02_9GAMM|nr:hypothetical protein [Umboniibacter marinipuniceus]RMA82698.1 hypothetical protein DFR27_0655 [Umboniibacter marinipuniceus]